MKALSACVLSWRLSLPWQRQTHITTKGSISHHQGSDCLSPGLRKHSGHGMEVATGSSEFYNVICVLRGHIFPVCPVSAPLSQTLKAELTTHTIPKPSP